MARSTKTNTGITAALSPRSVVALSLAGGALVALGVGVTTAAVSACSYVALRGPSDANPDPEFVQIQTEDCGTKPVALCDAMAPGANGCTGEPERGDAAASSTIPTDMTFPLGCTVNIPSIYPTPQGECLVAYACKCTSPGARIADGGSQWTCVR